MKIVSTKPAKEFFWDTAAKCWPICIYGKWYWAVLIKHAPGTKPGANRQGVNIARGFAPDGQPLTLATHRRLTREEVESIQPDKSPGLEEIEFVTYPPP